MKKILILVLFFFSIPQVVNASEYYVATNGSDTNPGTLTQPWKTLAKVNRSVFNPGDKILLQRNQTWYENMIVPSSGTSGNPITFGAYGSGAKPIITTRGIVPGSNSAGNWTVVNGAVWALNFSHDPGRLWINGIEYLRAVTSGGVNATTRWHYDSGARRLSVYAASNPAALYTSIEASNPSVGDIYTVELIGKNHVSLDNLDLRGGLDALHIQTASHLALSEMAIGRDSIFGIHTYASGTGSVDYVTVRDSLIESGYNFTYSGIESPGSLDGILLQRGATNWEIYNNTISNWGHSGFDIIQNTTQNTMANIDFHHNDVSGPNVSYTRAFVTQCVPNSSTAIAIHHNYFHDLSVRNQITSSNVSVYNNIFARVRKTNAVSEEKAQALSIESYPENNVSYPSTNNVVYNNTFYDVADACLRLQSAGNNSVSGNLIKNNIFIKCGQNSISHPNTALYIQNNSVINSNTFTHNDFHIQGQTTIINYRGTRATVANFQNNLSNSDVASNNLQSDPLLVGSLDFHLQSSSPAINTGVTLAVVTDDFDGIPRPQGTNYDIGAYEYVAYCYPLGNIDCTGTVSVLDLSSLISKFGTNDLLFDLDNSGIVNILDLSILLSNFGK